MPLNPLPAAVAVFLVVQVVRIKGRWLFGWWTYPLYVADFFNRSAFLPAMRQGLKNHLRATEPYYRALRPRERVLFEGRVLMFIRKKTFHARGGIKITPEMQVAVAAKAVQLTFGFPSVYLDHFDRFFIYPEAYRSRITGMRHQGEVHPMGVVVLSWEDAQRGNAHPEDGTNLILHELAHALLLENEQNNAEEDFLNPQALKRLDACRIRLGGEGVVGVFNARHLGSFHEFFAKSVEMFFESPQVLQSVDEGIYHEMREILRQ